MNKKQEDLYYGLMYYHDIVAGNKNLYDSEYDIVMDGRIKKIVEHVYEVKGGKYLHADVFSQAAALIFYGNKLQPFVIANFPTIFLTSIKLLYRKENKIPVLSQENIEDLYAKIQKQNFVSIEEIKEWLLIKVKFEA